MLKSWRTSLLGVVAIALGLWGAHIHWVHSNTVHFNIVYVLNAQEALILAGIGLLHARDHKTKD